MTTRVIAILGAGLVATLAACSRMPGAPAHEGVLQTIAAASTPVDRGAAPAPPERAVPAAGLPAGVPEFYVRARQPQLTKAPCLSCHTVPLTSMRGRASGGQARAHWAVELAHAGPAVMTCATCHAPANLDELRSLTGQPVTIDQAYLVCAQCHSRPAADWIGGAHGKRATGWSETRVVYSCTECHDPHRPKLETRWPAHAGRTGR